MSLNWKEIDLILSELDLAGAKIERVIQPSFDSLSLGLYKAGKTIELFFSIAQGACRIHALSSPPPKPSRPLRFMECLRSRIRGGRIESIAQIGDERVVKVELSVPRSTPGVNDRAELVEFKKFFLFARLWSGAGNIVLVDDEGIVVDALARRPKKGEISGEPYTIEEDLRAARASRGSGAKARVFETRELPGEGSFNERIEAFYAERGGELSREKLIEAARDRFGKKSSILEARIDELSARATEFRDAERLRELGDILMANQGIAYEGKYLACEDFYRGGQIRIPVDTRLSAVDNAREFYERHRKARSGLANVEFELEGTKASLKKLALDLAELEKETEPLLIARALAKGGTTRAMANGAIQKRSYPGLSLECSGWTILIGRSAKENDELLRRHIRGSDLWLHARDWPGSYVFIKGRKGKSVPLELLIDAGMLAIYYSKGRSNGGGNLYYTFAKYLRRAKDGPKGTVLPAQEKNLSVRLDDGRIKELRALIGNDENP
ncbi:MAG: NFACT RNA binding domain-containing protein [Rectinemataceae bacterium]|jgi:predicted ribosome quality control (RQC) complex YloA/Tae2 family protein